MRTKGTNKKQHDTKLNKRTIIKRSELTGRSRAKEGEQMRNIVKGARRRKTKEGKKKTERGNTKQRKKHVRTNATTKRKKENSNNDKQ